MRIVNAIVSRAQAFIVGAWANNPVRVVSIATAGIIALAAERGLILDRADVSELVAIVGTILLGGQVARGQVQPYQGEVGTPSDELLPLDQAPTP